MNNLNSINLAVKTSVYFITFGLSVMPLSFAFNKSSNLFPKANMLKETYSEQCVDAVKWGYFAGTCAYIGYSLYTAHYNALAVSNAIDLNPLNAAFQFTNIALKYCAEVKQEVVSGVENFVQDLATPLDTAGQSDYLIDNLHNIW